MPNRVRCQPAPSSPQTWPSGAGGGGRPARIEARGLRWGGGKAMDIAPANPRGLSPSKRLTESQPMVYKTYN